MASKADYTHEIKNYKGRNVIVVKDLNLGNKSVTNDIENVVSDIGIMEKLNPAEYMVVYQDSDGVWDGWNAAEGDFVPLREDNWYDAASTYVNWQISFASKRMASA